MDNLSNTDTASYTPGYPMDRSRHTVIDFGEPLDVDEYKITATGESNVCLLYNKTHDLEGKLLLVSRSEFLDLHSRFYDILLDYTLGLDEVQWKPWTLLHHSLGKTWAHVTDLPQPAAFLNICDMLRGAKELSFIAVTDNPEAYMKAYRLGEVDLKGDFVRSPEVAASFIDDIIVALLTDRPFTGQRQIDSYPISSTRITQIVVVDDYAPMPASPRLLEIIKEIRTASIDPSSTTKGRPNKTWLKTRFPEMNDEGFLRRDHELYRHRGNEALFPRSFWPILCYPVKLSEDQALATSKGQGGTEIPRPYYQHLFADLQARPRVEGSSRLKGVSDKYCDDFEPNPRLGLDVLRLDGRDLDDGDEHGGIVQGKL